MTEVTCEQKKLIKDKFQRGELAAFSDFANLAAGSETTFPDSGMYHSFRMAIQRGVMKKFIGLDEVGKVDLQEFHIETTDTLDAIGYKSYRVVSKRKEVQNI